MLVLSNSQAKNYYKKLRPNYYNEGCGCCSRQVTYVIKDKRILAISSGENAGYRYFNVSVIAIIKKARSN